MEWFQNSQITPAVQSALKRANQRIVQLKRTFGEDSTIYKQNVGKFNKAPFSQWMSESVGGQKIGRAGKEGKLTKGGNIKFDIRAVNQAIRKGEISRSEINRFLAEAGGITIDANGEIKKVKGGGIDTTSDIVKRTEKKLINMGEDPSELTKKEIQQRAEAFALFSENFQTSYDDYIAKFGESEARKDATIRLLYGDYRNRRLTYGEMEAIKARMDERIAKSRKAALKFEEENTSEL